MFGSSIEAYQRGATHCDIVVEKKMAENGDRNGRTATRAARTVSFTGEKAISLTDNKHVTLEFGVASENKRSREKKFTVEVRFVVVGKEFVDLGVLVEDEIDKVHLGDILPTFELGGLLGRVLDSLCFSLLLVFFLF